jgi:hypothetical protein
MPAYPFFALALGVWLADLGARARPASLALAAAAVAAALVCVDATPTNPFAEVAIMFPMLARWRALGGSPAAAAVVVAALAGAQRSSRCAAARARGRSPRRVSPWRSSARPRGGSAVRSASSTRSPRCLLHGARARARERPLARVPDSRAARLDPDRALLFADDYEIEARTTPIHGTACGSIRRATAVLDRSIGRLGLEKRLAQ